MYDLYKNIEDYNQNKKRKILIVWKKIATFFKRRVSIIL